MSQIQFVKHNRAKLKAGKRDESARMLLDFFSQLQASPILIRCLKGQTTG
jgi:hypothetical protein